MILLEWRSWQASDLLTSAFCRSSHCAAYQSGKLRWDKGFSWMVTNLDMTVTGRTRKVETEDHGRKDYRTLVTNALIVIAWTRCQDNEGNQDVMIIASFPADIHSYSHWSQNERRTERHNRIVVSSLVEFDSSIEESRSDSLTSNEEFRVSNPPCDFVFADWINLLTGIKFPIL